MKEIITALENLLNTLPINCSSINIQTLKLRFSEYQLLIKALPAKFISVKRYCEKLFGFMKARISAVENALLLKRNAKNIYMEAVDRIKTQIEMVILTLRAETSIP